MIRFLHTHGTYRRIPIETTGREHRRQKRLARKLEVERLKLKRRDEAIREAVAAVKELAAE